MRRIITTQPTGCRSPFGIARRGPPSDPLTGLTFTMRLQTHNGDNVPLGLWQDVAATIPATEEFDLVAAWTDELSASGVIATQADPDKQPVLVFVDGVPCLEFDGVDDFLSHGVGAAAAASLFGVARHDGAITYRCLFGLGSPSGPSMYARLSSSSWGAYMNTDVVSEAGAAVFAVMAEIVRAPNDIDLYTNNFTVTKTNGVSYYAIGSLIGAEAPGSSGLMAGPVCAVMAGAVDINHALVRGYLADIYGDIIGT